mgnify:CR=1 FL=1
MAFFSWFRGLVVWLLLIPVWLICLAWWHTDPQSQGIWQGLIDTVLPEYTRHSLMLCVAVAVGVALVGGAAAEVLRGGAGDDVIEGAGGGDTIDGGTGFDIASYDGAASGVRVSLDGATLDGADAPVRWRNGEHQAVCDYVLGDVRMTTAIVEAIEAETGSSSRSRTKLRSIFSLSSGIRRR